MLIEEAWLRGEIEAKDFYQDMYRLTSAEWIGPPKGQIEPIKEVQADVMAVENNFKTLEEVLLEQGRDLNSTLKQIEVEKDLQKDLDIQPIKQKALDLDMDDKDDQDDQDKPNGQNQNAMGEQL